MKIAFVNQPLDGILPPDQNSIGLWTYEVARRLAKSYHITVYTGGKRLYKEVKCIEDVHYQRIPRCADQWMQRILKRWPGYRDAKRPLFASQLNYLMYILRIAGDLRTKQCDIVHIHNYYQFVPIIRTLNPRIKIVLHMHCEWLAQLDRGMIKRRIRKVDEIIGCSNYITRSIKRRFPDFTSRCQTVYNGVDSSRFANENVKKKNNAKRLLFVGRVSPEKGVHVLIDAFQRVSEHYPEARLKIVGPQKSASIEFIVSLSDDPMVSNLARFYQRSYLSHLQGKLSPILASRVSFTGCVPHSQLVSYLWDADVFLHPSVWGEPFPLAILEAMAAGLPVVATRVGGLPESIVHGKTGFLVEPDNAIALADAILQLLSDENLRDLMGKAARRRAVEYFPWEETVEQLLCLYNSIHERN